MFIKCSFVSLLENERIFSLRNQKQEIHDPMFIYIWNVFKNKFFFYSVCQFVYRFIPVLSWILFLVFLCVLLAMSFGYAFSTVIRFQTDGQCHHHCDILFNLFLFQFCFISTWRFGKHGFALTSTLIRQQNIICDTQIREFKIQMQLIQCRLKA